MDLISGMVVLGEGGEICGVNFVLALLKLSRILVGDDSGSVSS